MGIFDKVKSAAKGAYDSKMADMKERVSNPDAWEAKQSDKRMVKMQRQNKELQMNAKNSRLEASIARSQASRRRYEPHDSGMGGGFGGIDLGGSGGGMGGFDMSGGGMGGFDMNGGGGFGGIDLGMGGSPKKHKRPNKKAKGKKGDIHITIRK